jgi:ketosteroid isomerase-like protein
MAEENIAIARRALEAFNAFMRGELAGTEYAREFDPGIEVHWHEQTYPDTPQRLRGARELLEFSEQYRAGWADLVQEALEISEAPDGRVLALIRQSGRGRESGVPIAIHFFEVCTVRDGRVCRMEYFRHRVDALAAAGMRE